MSTAVEEFYGVRCDYPECGDVYEGSEYSYFSDTGSAAEYANDDGWLIGFEGKDYCTDHVVTPDEEDEGDEHLGLRPLPDTFAAKLEVAMNRALDRAERKLAGLAYRMDEKLAPHGYSTFRGVLDGKLDAIFAGAVRAIRPDISGQELYDLKRNARQ